MSITGKIWNVCRMLGRMSMKTAMGRRFKIIISLATALVIIRILNGKKMKISFRLQFWATRTSQHFIRYILIFLYFYLRRHSILISFRYHSVVSIILLESWVVFHVLQEPTDEIQYKGAILWCSWKLFVTKSNIRCTTNLCWAVTQEIEQGILPKEY